MTRRAVALAQSAYYVAGGAWPFFSMRSFLALSGPKVDLWLVRNVGLLMILIGAVLGRRARRGAVDDDAALLGAGSAAIFAGVDVWYAGVRRRIAPTYLLDAALQAAIVAAWLRARGPDPPAGSARD